MGIDLNGSSSTIDYGDLANMDGATKLSIALWLNSDSIAAGTPSIVGKDTGGTNTLILYRSAATLIATMNATDAGQTGNVLTAGTWAHVVVVYDGAETGNANRLKIYVNGALETLNFGASTIPATAPDSGAGTYVLGKVANLAGYFDGKCALHLLWIGTALTAGEALQQMNSYRPVNFTNLKVWSPFDDGTSPKDYSGSGNHGTPTDLTAISGPPVSYGAQVAA